MNDLVRYNIKKYANNYYMLVRYEKRETPIQGLPPEGAHVIMFEDEDFDQLLECVNNYADKRRSETV